MKTQQDYIKLDRLYKIEVVLVEAFNKAVTSKIFPPYFDRWCKVHKMVGEEIVNLKYK